MGALGELKPATEQVLTTAFVAIGDVPPLAPTRTVRSVRCPSTSGCSHTYHHHWYRPEAGLPTGGRLPPPGASAATATAAATAAALEELFPRVDVSAQLARLGARLGAEGAKWQACRDSCDDDGACNRREEKGGGGGREVEKQVRGGIKGEDVVPRRVALRCILASPGTPHHLPQNHLHMVPCSCRLSTGAPRRLR